MTQTNQWVCLEWHTPTLTIFAACSMYSMHGMQMFCMHGILEWLTCQNVQPKHTIWETLSHNIMS